MPYQFLESEPLPIAIPRIVNERLDQALGELDGDPLHLHHSAHQTRKRVKEVRAVLRLIRIELDGAYQFENDWFRDTARELASLREAQALLESLEKLRRRFREGPRRPFYAARRRLRRRRDKLVRADREIPARLNRVAERLREARARVATWPLDADSSAFLGDELESAHRSARKAFRTAIDDPSPQNLHEWRKRVKRQWYHAQLLRDASPSLKKYRQNLEELSDFLGDHHDLTLLRSALPPEDEGVSRLIEIRLIELEEAARNIGERMYAGAPKKTARLLRRAWRSL